MSYHPERYSHPLFGDDPMAGEPGSSGNFWSIVHRGLDPMNVGEEFLDPAGYQQRRMSPGERGLQKGGLELLQAALAEKIGPFSDYLTDARQRASAKYGVYAPEVYGEGQAQSRATAGSMARRGISGPLAGGAQQGISQGTQQALNMLRSELESGATKEALGQRELDLRDRLARLQAGTQMLGTRPTQKPGALSNLLGILASIFGGLGGASSGGAQSQAGGGEYIYGGYDPYGHGYPQKM